jgi:hypothetical protein
MTAIGTGNEAKKELRLPYDCLVELGLALLFATKTS